MSRSEKEATVIIFDVGRNSGGKSVTDEKSFFNKSKSCINKILQRKIFGKPKDEVSLILMGTDGTSNSLNDEFRDSYKFITETIEMAITSWAMLRVIEDEVKTQKEEADWLDALIVAVNVLRTNADTRKYTSLKIVLFTTFSTVVNDDHVQKVIESIENLKIELIVISNNVEFKPVDENDSLTGIFSQSQVKSKEQQRSEKLIEKIVWDTNGVLCNFEHAIVNMMYFPKKKVSGMPWNCPLSIGSDIKINISSYIFITEDKVLPSWKTESDFANTESKTVTEYFHNEKKIDVDFDTLIKGYMYGTSVIPCTEDFNIKLKGTEKCLMCIGFTNEESVLDEYLCGIGTSIIVANKNCEQSKEALTSLIDAMISTKKVMIARKVYRASLSPKLVVLIPTRRSNYPCFSAMELNFAENLIYFNFPSLKNSKYDPTAEQLDVIDKLIDSMDLMDAFDDDADNPREAFAYKKTLNPSTQYIYRCLAQRSLRPREPLAKPDKSLLDMLEIPEKLKVNSKEHVNRIAELFPLEKLEKPTFQYKFPINLSDEASTKETSAIDPNEDILSDRRNLLVIGTVTPAEDLAYLLHRGEKFSTLCNQIQSVISDLVFKSMTLQEEKIGAAMLLYREESKILGAYYYNDWISNFKNVVIGRGKIDFWENVIVKEQLGLICSAESDTTTLDVAAAKEFYNTAIESDVATATGDNDKEDVEDLFDM